jgi:di/tricarboxylate transporter
MEMMVLPELGWQGILTLGVVAGTFTVLLLTRLSSDYVFMAGLVVLLLTGVLDTKETFAGFSSPGLITVGVLYVVVNGMKETGGLLWISQRVLGLPTSGRKAQIRLMLPVSFLSAFLNNTPIVALFIPIVKDWSRRIRVQPSRLLIPLSYASILGGTCTLIGTSTNLIVNGMVQTRYGGEGLHLFEIAKIGVPLAVTGMIFILMTPRLLPSRKPFDEIVANPREYTLELKVTPGGSIENKTIESAGLRRLPGAFVAELIRDGHVYPAVPPDTVLQANDRLVFVGNVESIKSLYEYKDLHPAADQIFKLDYPRHKRIMVEAVVSNTCPLLGNSIREGRFRERYNAVVVAVARNGERIKGRIGDIVLRPGDTLLVESHAGFISRQKDTRDFYLVNEIENFSPRRFDRAPVAFAILAGMIAVVSFGWLTMLEASFGAAAMMLLTGSCSPGGARRSIEWEVLLTIAAALGLGAALDKTGAAGLIAGYLLNLTGKQPWMALAMVM